MLLNRGGEKGGVSTHICFKEIKRHFIVRRKIMKKSKLLILGTLVALLVMVAATEADAIGYKKGFYRKS